MSGPYLFQPTSTRFLSAPCDWRDSLRARLLEPPTAIDKAQLFSWFRSMNRFYADLAIGHIDFSLGKKNVKDVAPQPRSPGLYHAKTSGTTGRVLTVFYSPEEFRFKAALLNRPFDLYDLPSRTVQVILLDIAESLRGPSVESGGGRIYETYILSASVKVDRQMEILRQVRPAMLRGFPSAMVALAEAVPHRELKALGIRILSPSGEFLPAAWRKLLTTAFHGRVLDRYGATETGAIAWQCPYCDEYHANSDEQLLETSDVGNLLVTPLYLTTQPLYRYDLGDRVELLEPNGRCRIRLRRLVIHEARRDDWLFDGYGRRVSPLVFSFEQFAEVRTWKVHQEADGAISVAVTGDQVDAACVTRILRHVADKVPGRPVGAEPNSLRIFPGRGKFKRVSSDLLQSEIH